MPIPELRAGTFDAIVVSTSITEERPRAGGEAVLTQKLGLSLYLTRYRPNDA